MSTNGIVNGCHVKQNSYINIELIHIEIMSDMDPLEPVREFFKKTMEEAISSIVDSSILTEMLDDSIYKVELEAASRGKVFLSPHFAD